MNETGWTRRRAGLASIGVLLTTGLARTAAMLATATAVGADVASEDPVARRDGLLIGVGILGGVTAGGLVLAWLTRPAPEQVLAVARPAPLAALGWIVLLLAHGLLFDGISTLMGRPAIEPAWADAYRTAPVVLLVVALVATSIYEELYFRGLLQHTLAQSRIGVPGAIGAVALLFAIVHLPDDAVRFADVFSAGVLLGLARQQSGSTVPGMVGHVLGNLKVLAVLAAAA